MRDSIPGSCVTTEANDGLLVIYLQLRLPASRPVPSLLPRGLAAEACPPSSLVLYIARCREDIAPGAEPHKSESRGRDLPNTPFQQWGPRQKFKGKEKLYGSLKEGYREALLVDHVEPSSDASGMGSSPSFQRSGPLSLKPDSAHVFRSRVRGGKEDEALLRKG